jgi:hypothetical protein
VATALLYFPSRSQSTGSASGGLGRRILTLEDERRAKLERRRGRQSQQSAALADRLENICRSFRSRDWREVHGLLVRELPPAGARLITEAGPARLSVALALRAEAVAYCGERTNHYTAGRMETLDGDEFTGAGVLYHCCVNGCPSCEDAKRRRMRAIARRQLAAAKEAVAELGLDVAPRFITNTSPTVPAVNASPILASRVYSRYRAILSKPRWYQREVVAGFWATEFTPGQRHIREGREWSLEAGDGFHAHNHGIILSTWLDFNDWRRHHTESVERAWAEFGIDINLYSQAELYRTQILRIVDRPRPGRSDEIAEERAIEDALKYAIKPQDVAAMPDAYLAAYVLAPRLPRMAEEHGLMRPAVRERRLAEGRQSILVLNNVTFSSASAPATSSPTPTPAAKQRQKKDLSAYERILKGRLSLAEAKRELAGRVARVRRFRAVQLAWRHPLADFRLLTGKTWNLREVATVRFARSDTAAGASGGH